MTPAYFFAFCVIALLAVGYDAIRYARRKAAENRKRWGGT